MVLIVVQCDRCGERVEKKKDSRYVTKTSLLRTLRSKGWSFGRERMLCPGCVRQTRLQKKTARLEAAAARVSRQQKSVGGGGAG